MALTITEPRDVPAAELAEYVGWRMSPTYAVNDAYGGGGMVQGVITSVRPGDPGRMVIEFERTVSRGVTVPDSAVIATESPRPGHPFRGPNYVEVVTSHTVPDSVPGADAYAQHAAIFDRVDARGCTIAEAIASFAAETGTREAA